MATSDAPPAPAKSGEHAEPWWKRTARSYLTPSMASMLMLGFASGLPIYLVYQKTAFWLSEEGISRSTIGFFSWVGLLYSFKFIWAPIIDKIELPRLNTLFGHRRSWMMISIAGTVAGLTIMSSADPSENLWPVTVGALMLAFSGATLDVSIDAWRIESAPTELQANMAAAYSFGYRFALIYSGLGFVLAGLANWNVSFVVMALSMGLTGALVLLIKEPPSADRPTIDESDSPLRRIRKLFAEPFQQVWARYGTLLIPIF
ncbi:MAG: MFS transporter, partial [Pseudomonadota bacterium]